MAQWITLQEALDLVKNNDMIVTGLGAAEGQSFFISTSHDCSSC